ncbi:MAG: c-type cytochrome [Alphaproteobacteria bacterium]|nr:c-type cytochrome [Alphaproteobacteria bacterium]
MENRIAACFAAVMFLTMSSAAVAETPLERGTYLMQSIVACGNCHTPKGPNGELPGMELAGGFKFDEPPFTAYASNITPDKETGIGNWTDEQLIKAIREGVRPDGSIIGPPMPIVLYRGLSDSDAKALVAYMRNLPPIKNQVPKSVYRIPLPPAYGPPVGQVADVPKTDKVAYGAYLAGPAGPAGHCTECHTPMGERGRRDYQNRLGAGGFEFHGPWGTSVAANLTPTGLKDVSDADLKKMIAAGTRPDGGRMLPPMAYPYYANISAEDLDAIVAYLRTLPPK